MFPIFASKFSDGIFRRFEQGIVGNNNGGNSDRKEDWNEEKFRVVSKTRLISDKTFIVAR